MRTLKINGVKFEEVGTQTNFTGLGAENNFLEVFTRVGPISNRNWTEKAEKNITYNVGKDEYVWFMYIEPLKDALTKLWMKSEEYEFLKEYEDKDIVMLGYVNGIVKYKEGEEVPTIDGYKIIIGYNDKIEENV